MAGETTSLSDPAEAKRHGRKLSGAGLTYYSMTATYSATNQLETNDVMEVGYLPSGVTVVGLSYHPTDMDTDGSPAVVQKVTVGSTDVATGLTGAQSGTASFSPVAATDTGSSPALVKITTTTAAATGATGSVVLGFWYYTS